MDFSNLPCFFYTVGCKSTWLTAIKTHCLPALSVFNTLMLQNALLPKLEVNTWRFFACYWYAI